MCGNRVLEGFAVHSLVNGIAQRICIGDEEAICGWQAIRGGGRTSQLEIILHSPIPRDRFGALPIERSSDATGQWRSCLVTRRWFGAWSHGLAGLVMMVHQSERGQMEWKQGRLVGFYL